MLEPHAEAVRTLALSKPGVTLKEIRAALATRGVEVKALSTIADMLHRPGLSHKKSRAAEPERPDVARHRDRWRVWQRYMDGERFVFKDETSASANMVRLRGWEPRGERLGPRGERLLDATPYGHWRTTTFVAGLKADGIVAPSVLNGPITGDIFRAYVEEMLAPALQPGDVVVLDNLAAHKVAGFADAIRAAGASLM